MTNTNSLTQLDSRDELVLILIAGIVPLLTLANLIHVSL
jgi:hypothetical protein